MKLHSILLMAAATICLASCSSDEPAHDAQGVEGSVVLTVSVPAEISTRAGVSDGAKLNQIAYVVYNVSDNDEVTLQFTNPFEPADFTGGETTLNIPLAKGMRYKVAFFAKNQDAAYTLDDAGCITLPASIPANSDIYDAFYGISDTVEVPESGICGGSVTLKRPFAQINVAEVEYASAEALGIDLRETGIAFSAETYTTLNLKDGSVSNPQPISFTANGADSLGTITVNGDDYKWLAMAYVLVGAETSLVSNVTFSWTVRQYEGSSYVTKSFATDVTSVPVQRNRRTNIIGSFLTGGYTPTIILDSEF